VSLERTLLTGIGPLARGVALVLALHATPSAAQERADEAPDRLRVDVTGTHIRRTDLESALPVQVITREEIERSGVTTPAELMSRIPANLQSVNDQHSIGNQIGARPRPGLSSVNLRGLGDGNTLVLVNGRRVANYAFDGSTVDVNAIPLTAIDRVEILKDGASAIYGTDAVAGVVNFILRKDFRGVEASATGAWTERGGGDQAQASFTAGAGDLARDRYNVFGTIQVQRDDALRAADRSFARRTYLDDGWLLISRDGFPSNVWLPGFRLGSPAFEAGCAPPDSVPANIFGSDACWYNVGGVGDIMPRVERVQAYGRATFQASPDWQLFAEAGVSRNEFRLAYAPTPADGQFLQGGERLLYPATGPYYPSAFAAANGLVGDLDLAYRTVPLGNRVNEVDSTAARVLLGVDGSYRGWDIAAGVLYGQNRQSDWLTSGYVSQRALVDAMATGLVNPFGPSGPEGDALLASTEVGGEYHRGTARTWLVDARASGEVVRLPTGPLSVAFGAEWRRESLDNSYAALAQSGDVIGTGRNEAAVDARRDVAAVYAEASVPIARGLEAQLAVRHDDYSDFGGTTNPKVALRWQPDPRFLARASWGEGFRAPSLYDLYTPLRAGRTSPFVEDPLRCPQTGQPSDCLGEFPTVFGGNPALGPEASEQFNAGLVWEPVLGFSIGIDYWNIRKSGVIMPLFAEEVLRPDSPWLASNVVRGPVEPAYPDLPGPIERLILVTENVGNLRTAGYDLRIAWRGSATPAGTFSLALDGTYVESYEWRFDDGSRLDGAGRNTFGTTPRWRHYLSLGWSYDAWTTTLAQTFQSSYDEIDDRACDDTGCPDRKVGSYNTWDLQLRYAAAPVTVALGVRNLFDRAPPFTSFTTSFANGFDAYYADPRGRTYYATLAYAFR